MISQTPSDELEKNRRPLKSCLECQCSVLGPAWFHVPAFTCSVIFVGQFP